MTLQYNTKLPMTIPSSNQRIKIKLERVVYTEINAAFLTLREDAIDAVHAVCE